MQSNRLQHLLAFLEKAPQDSFTLYSLAYEYLQLEQPQKAVEYFQQLLNLDPAYVGAYYHLGKTLETLGQAAQAQKTYETGMAQARSQRDMHAFSELQGAYHQLLGLDEDDY